jgi:hypothetical protein
LVQREKFIVDDVSGHKIDDFGVNALYFMRGV